MRMVLTQILRGFSLGRIIEVDDGADAFAEMRASAVDFVIYDWMMEPLDGYDFTRLVRTAKDSPNPFIPIIMLTGHMEVFRVMQARDAGVTEFLAKPVSAQTLYRRIVSVIENQRAFVRAPQFVGPDRRRHKTSNRVGEERRASEKAKAQNAAAPAATDAKKNGHLSPAEVQALLRS